MIRMLKRIVLAAQNFRRGVAENRKITSGLASSAILALRLRLRRNADVLYSGLAFRGLRFVSRYRDWLAVREVIFDGEYRLVKDVLRDSVAPIVVDGGANIGMFAIYVLAYFPSAKVTSYEPGTSTFALLDRNRALNVALNWSVRRAALWRSAETLELSAAESSTSSKVGRGKGTELVPGRDLRAVLADVGGHIDLMKVDIEGAEESFLCASPEALRDIEHLLVEIHPAECDAAAVIAILRGRWSRVYRVPGRISSKPLLLASDGEFNLPEFMPEGT